MDFDNHDAIDSSVRSIKSPGPGGFGNGVLASDSLVRSTTSTTFLLPLDGTAFAKGESLRTFDWVEPEVAMADDGAG